MTKIEVANMWERIVALENQVAELRILTIPARPRAEPRETLPVESSALEPPRDRHLPETVWPVRPE